MAVTVATLFDRLGWTGPRDKALHWILENPVTTRRWEGCYEDVGVLAPFTNLSNHEALETIRYRDPDGTTLLELRSTGTQTIWPGSKHPSGERVRFDDEGQPTQVDRRALS